jgi:hypothetical protein
VLGDLRVSLEEATSELYSAFFIEEQGTMSRLRGVQEVMEPQGLFSSLYADRGHHDGYPPEAGARSIRPDNHLAGPSAGRYIPRVVARPCGRQLDGGA